MICLPCREGADRITSAKRRSTLTPDEVTFILGKAKESHGMCAGKTWCDCQHKVSVPQRAVKSLRPADENSHTCMQCGTTTPDCMFCDDCGGVYCINDLPPRGEHNCTAQGEENNDGTVAAEG